MKELLYYLLLNNIGQVIGQEGNIIKLLIQNKYYMDIDLDNNTIQTNPPMSQWAIDEEIYIKIIYWAGTSECRKI